MSLDEYAQDVQHLFYLAYQQTQQGTEETEVLGRTVLAYQFVAGLKPNFKPKLAGVEGTFDQLLVRIRFKKAKACDLSLVTTTSTKPQSNETPRKPYRMLFTMKLSNQHGMVDSSEDRPRDKSG